MASNRRNEPMAVRFGPAIKALVLCVFIGGSGIGYVGQKNQLHILGAQFKAREVKLDRLRHENDEKEGVLKSLESPRELDARVKQMNLDLIAPQPNQIIRLVEHKPARNQPGADRLYVEHTTQRPRQP